MLTEPTHVFGYGAADYAQGHGWSNTVVIEGDSINSSLGAKGDTPDTKRTVHVTPGDYHTAKFGMGQRRYGELRGDPADKPRIFDASVGCTRYRSFTVRGLDLINTQILGHSFATDGPAELTVEDNYQHGWNRYANGISAGNETHPLPVAVNVRRNHFDNVGSSNSRHTLYGGVRAGGVLTVEDNVAYGAHGSSIFKAKFNTNIFRRNRLYTRSQESTYTAHTMLDIVSCSKVIASHNTFCVWVGDRKKYKTGRNGLRTACIYLRRRASLYANDRPAYPDKSWDPPLSETQTGFLSPGKDWPADCSTYVDDAFHQDVASYEFFDLSNPFAYQKFISDNEVLYELGPEGEETLELVPLVRDDGTWPIYEVSQLGRQVCPRVHPLQSCRSEIYLCNNRGNFLPPELTLGGELVEREPGYVERTEPHHFPRAKEVPPELPPNVALVPPSWFPQ